MIAAVRAMGLLEKNAALLLSRDHVVTCLRLHVTTRDAQRHTTLLRRNTTLSRSRVARSAQPCAGSQGA